jgi:hypothetical protein
MSRCRTWRSPFYIKLCLYYIRALIPLGTHFLMVSGVLELVMPLLRLKMKNLKKRTPSCPASWHALSNLKKLNISNEPGQRNLGCQIRKFYHNFFTTGPTYPKHCMPFERTWAETDFWGGGALSLSTVTSPSKSCSYAATTKKEKRDSIHCKNKLEVPVKYTLLKSRLFPFGTTVVDSLIDFITVLSQKIRNC